MAKTKVYKITEDGAPDRYLKLDDKGYDLFKALADDKTAAVKSVSPGTPTPINAGGKA